MTQPAAIKYPVTCDLLGAMTLTFDPQRIFDFQECLDTGEATSMRILDGRQEAMHKLCKSYAKAMQMLCNWLNIYIGAYRGTQGPALYAEFLQVLDRLGTQQVTVGHGSKSCTHNICVFRLLLACL